MSGLEEVAFGIPQGTIFGPMLFPTSISNSILKLSLLKLQQNISTDLKILHWLKRHHH